MIFAGRTIATTAPQSRNWPRIQGQGRGEALRSFSGGIQCRKTARASGFVPAAGWLDGRNRCACPSSRRFRPCLFSFCRSAYISGVSEEASAERKGNRNREDCNSVACSPPRCDDPQAVVPGHEGPCSLSLPNNKVISARFIGFLVNGQEYLFCN